MEVEDEEADDEYTLAWRGETRHLETALLV